MTRANARVTAERRIGRWTIVLEMLVDVVRCCSRGRNR
jgi:hypothetical protein